MFFPKSVANKYLKHITVYICGPSTCHTRHTHIYVLSSACVQVYIVTSLSWEVPAIPFPKLALSPKDRSTTIEDCLAARPVFQPLVLSIWRSLLSRKTRTELFLRSGFVPGAGLLWSTLSCECVEHWLPII